MLDAYSDNSGLLNSLLSVAARALIQRNVSANTLSHGALITGVIGIVFFCRQLSIFALLLLLILGFACAGWPRDTLR